MFGRRKKYEPITPPPAETGFRDIWALREKVLEEMLASAPGIDRERFVRIQKRAIEAAAVGRQTVREHSADWLRDLHELHLIIHCDAILMALTEELTHGHPPGRDGCADGGDPAGG